MSFGRESEEKTAATKKQKFVKLSDGSTVKQKTYQRMLKQAERGNTTPPRLAQPA